MAAIKSYTDLPQSKKLMEFLPIESADMHYIIMGDDENPQSMIGLGEYIGILPTIPCWSLAALLEIIPDIAISESGEDLKLHIKKDGIQYYLFYENEYTGNMFEIETDAYDDMVDTCYEMILKLHKQNLL